MEIQEELDLVQKVRERYSDSSLFLYPDEITTSSYLLEPMQEVGQTYTLSNGLRLDDVMVDSMLEVGMKSVKVTFFANAEEQEQWQQINATGYRRIEQNICRAIQRGLSVSVNNVLWRDNIQSIVPLLEKCADMGVYKVQLIRDRTFEEGTRYIRDKDMDEFVIQVERAKELFPGTPQISINYSFAGPNFYGKTLDEARVKLKTKEWVTSPYLCPAVDQNYWGISSKSGKVSWCPFTINMEQGKLGYINKNTGEVVITERVDLRPETLREKLRGKCAKDACDYQSVCLGGCRITASLLAQQRGEEDPLYAEMDTCLTKVYERVFGGKK
ncbi:hypothetical protein CL620_00090 [archaeon]|nr:hypothetical protein [archaeon]